MIKSKRVIHLIPGFFPITGGGAEYFVLNLCKGLKKYQIESIIITRRYKNLKKKEIINGLTVRRFENYLPEKIKKLGIGINVKSKYLRMLVALGDLLGELIILFKICRKLKISLIHSSFIVPTGLIGIIIKKLLKIPLIITVHGPADFYNIPKLLRKTFRYILKRADKVICVSKRLEKDIKKELRIKNTNTILNGTPKVDYSYYRNKKILRKYELNKEINRPIIIMTGRLIKSKRNDLLIKAIPRLSAKFPGVKVIILGEGRERQNLFKLAKKLGVEGNIIMPGWVSEEDKRDFLGISDIFVHLSTEEGMSLSLIESQFASLPVIVPNSRFANEIIKNGYNGLYLKEPIKIEDIVKKIEIIYSNKDIYEKFSRNSLSNSTRFTLEKMVKNYYTEYKKIMR